MPRLSLLEASQAAARIRRARAVVVPFHDGDTPLPSPCRRDNLLHAAEAGLATSPRRGGQQTHLVNSALLGGDASTQKGMADAQPYKPAAVHQPRRRFPPLLRVPAQMAVAATSAAALFVFRRPHDFFRGTGLWTSITIVLVLEPSCGATSKKARLRLGGTILGGGLGGGIVALARLVNGPTWDSPPGGDAVPKSLAVCASIGVACGALQFLRGWDVVREYAYTVAMITLTLTSLSDFYADDWKNVRLAVWWRCCTIVTGVIICAFSSAAVLPVYASDVARATLGECLTLAGNLIEGVARVYTTDTPTLEDGCQGNSALHDVEGQLCTAIERLRPIAAQALEETRCCGLLAPGVSALGAAPFAAACGRARLLYTGSVALLHFLESGDFVALGLCMRHMHGARAAAAALARAMHDVGAVVAQNELHAAQLVSCLEAAETEVARLLHGASHDSNDGATAAEIETLGHLCFALADGLRQLKCLVCDLDAASGPHEVAALEKRTAHAIEAPLEHAAPQTMTMVARAQRRLSVLEIPNI